jgi:hypothetical protein
MLRGIKLVNDVPRMPNDGKRLKINDNSYMDSRPTLKCIVITAGFDTNASPIARG